MKALHLARTSCNATLHHRPQGTATSKTKLGPVQPGKQRKWAEKKREFRRSQVRIIALRSPILPYRSHDSWTSFPGIHRRLKMVKPRGGGDPARPPWPLHLAAVLSHRQTLTGIRRQGGSISREPDGRAARSVGHGGDPAMRVGVSGSIGSVMGQDRPCEVHVGEPDLRL